MQTFRFTLVAPILLFVAVPKLAAQAIEWPVIAHQSADTATVPLRKRALMTETRSLRRGVIVGGVVGAIAGGLGAAAYVLNATAYRCTTIGAPCTHNPQTPRRVATIGAGAAVGAALGAWIGHRLSSAHGTALQSLPPGR